MNKRQAKKFYKKREDRITIDSWVASYIWSYNFLNVCHRTIIRGRMHLLHNMPVIPEPDCVIIPLFNEQILADVQENWTEIITFERRYPTLTRKLRRKYHLWFNDPVLRKLRKRGVAKIKTYPIIGNYNL